MQQTAARSSGRFPECIWVPLQEVIYLQFDIRVPVLQNVGDIESLPAYFVGGGVCQPEGDGAVVQPGDGPGFFAPDFFGAQIRKEYDAPVLEWFAGLFPQVGDAAGGQK